jgi:hypothetical protein
MSLRRVFQFGNVPLDNTVSRVLYIQNHSDVPASYGFQVCMQPAPRCVRGSVCIDSVCLLHTASRCACNQHHAVCEGVFVLTVCAMPVLYGLQVCSVYASS